jgi:hypothetical protein
MYMCVYMYIYVYCMLAALPFVGVSHPEKISTNRFSFARKYVQGYVLPRVAHARRNGFMYVFIIMSMYVSIIYKSMHYSHVHT